MAAKTTWQVFGAAAGALLGVVAGALLGGLYALFSICGGCIGLTVAYAFVGDRETTSEEDAATAAAVAKCTGVGAVIASALGAVAPPAIAVAIIIEQSRKPATGEEGWAWFGFFIFVVPVSALVALVGLVLGIVAVVRGDRRNGWIGVALCPFWPALLVVSAALGVLSGSRH